MGNSFVSNKGREAELYPKSAGESANNENQIITPFEWKEDSTKTLVIVSVKSGYTVLVENAAAAPTITEEGRMYFNTTDKHFYGYNGTAWVQLDN